MIQEQFYNQYKLMSHQDVNSITNCGGRLFPQKSVVEPSYFLMIQGSAHKLLAQLNDAKPSYALMTQDQHKFMSYQCINTYTYSGDDFFKKLV